MLVISTTICIVANRSCQTCSKFPLDHGHQHWPLLVETIQFCNSLNMPSLFLSCTCSTYTGHCPHFLELCVVCQSWRTETSVFYLPLHKILLSTCLSTFVLLPWALSIDIWACNKLLYPFLTIPMLLSGKGQCTSFGILIHRSLHFGHPFLLQIVCSICLVCCLIPTNQMLHQIWWKPHQKNDWYKIISINKIQK